MQPPAAGAGSSVTWARGQTVAPTKGRVLSAQERHLLLLLASYAGECAPWPTVAVLAGLMLVGPRRVQQLLASLEAAGLISRDTRGGRGHASDFTLYMEVSIKGEKGEVQNAPIVEGKGEVQNAPLAQKGEMGEVQNAPLAQKGRS